jgi:voltage-gated potassium channel Kch
MQKNTFMDRLRYAFDNYMSKGMIALLAGLLVISAIMIFLVAALVRLTGSQPEGTGFLGLAWMGLLRTLDTGTMGGDTGSPFFLFMMLVVTLGGVFTVSTLIGILNNGLEDKLDELRKGRSRVIEADHTVILGWSEQIFSIISELVLANESRKVACIVILGDKDKLEMEEEIADKVGDTKRTRVVCRNGSPMEPSDLEIVNLPMARSIIVLAPEGDEPDTSVIKTMLAIINNPNRKSEPYHIVAEISDAKNFEVAKLVGKDEVELILVGSLISRVIAQTCRQSGLSVVYTELLDFGGDEIYFKAEPSLVGKTFGETLMAYEDSAVIGVQVKGQGSQLNPPMDLRIQAGDELIVIAEDDDKINLSSLKDWKIKGEAINLREPAKPAPENTLIIGWNWRAPLIINEMDNYVAPGSEVLVVADTANAHAEIVQRCAGLKNQAVKFEAGDTTDRRLLDSLAVETYKHVIVLAYDGLDTQQADARTLITLLHLRDIAERTKHIFSIVSEMLDVRNRNLAEVTKADDFIVSDRLISLMLAQVSENKALNAVFADIFDPEGSEVYLKPASSYVKTGVPVNFYTVVEAAKQRGEVAFGYRLSAQAKNAEKAYGVAVNPDKSKEVTFGEGDKIVVLAES